MAQNPVAHTHTPFDASWHLRAELKRVLDALTRYLVSQRQRGRTAAGDVVRGLVIEDGEVEGLLADLAASLTSDTSGGAPAPSKVDEIAQRADSAADQGAFLPLRHVQKVFDLAPEEYFSVLLALAVETDSRFGRVIAYLNDHVGRTRPTIGLALALASLETGRPASTAGLLDRPFIRDGLVETEGDAPLPGLTLKMPRQLADRLAGQAWRFDEPWLSVHLPDGALLDRLVLEEPARRQLSQWSDGIRGRREMPPLLIAGVAGNGRSTAGRAALFRAGLRVVQADIVPEDSAARLRLARCEARWHHAALLVRLPPPAQQPIDWTAIWKAIGGDRPAVIVLSPDQAADATAAAPVEPAVIRIDEPAVSVRARLWTALLPRGSDVKESEVAELAARFPFGPGRITRSIGRATAGLCLREAGQRRLDFAALLDAARAVDAASIGPLAQKMPLPYERTDLIVPAHVASELDLAVAWVKHRHRVLHEWGFVRRVTSGHGLTALFSGPSGTGKTMAAQVLARELGLDLHRIDLSQIMSKYIGETEKNLAVVFNARIGVLFFDEAEVILGRRHETKDARDRYANVEIAYLLQRMEDYDGVTVLATNRMQDIDEAFIRRLHIVIDFPMPSEADRLRIWEGMIPTTADRAADLDLPALAREFDISGGQIKNAALAAAYLAASHEKPIDMEHLRLAATRELVKGGKVVEQSRG